VGISWMRHVGSLSVPACHIMGWAYDAFVTTTVQNMLTWL